jgi:DNA-binding beta-propeller fold protein YncE
MRRFLAIVSVVASGLGAAGAGDQDYFLSVPSQGAIHRVDAVTLQATPFLTGLNTPFYGFHDASGNLYIPDHLFGAILRIDPLGIPSLLTAGGYLTAPLALIADPTGGVLATDKYQNTVVHVDDLGNQTLLHDDISSNGLLFGPAGLDFDLAGNLYVSNNTGNTIVRIDPANQLTLWSDSPLIKTPGGIAIDGSGNMFVAMYDGNNIVRFRVDTAEAEVFAEDLSIMIRPNDLKLSRGGHLLTTTRLGNLVSIDATGKPTELFKGPGWSDVLGVSVPEDWKSCTGTATTYGQGLAGAGGFVPQPVRHLLALPGRVVRARVAQRRRRLGDDPRAGYAKPVDAGVRWHFARFAARDRARPDAGHTASARRGRPRHPIHATERPDVDRREDPYASAVRGCSGAVRSFDVEWAGVDDRRVRNADREFRSAAASPEDETR